MSKPANRAGDDLSRAVIAGFAYFAVVFATGFVLGALRIFLLNPRLGGTVAVLVELPAILAVSWTACRRLIAAFDVPPQLAPRLTMGAVAFLALLCAELGLSVLAFGRTVAEHLDGYRDAPSFLGLAGQVAFGLFPLLQLRSGHGLNRA